MTNPTTWNDGTAPDDDAPETPELFTVPPFWKELSEAAQALWQTQDFFKTKYAMRGRINPASDQFSEQALESMISGLQNARILDAAGRMLRSTAKVAMGRQTGFLGLLGAAIGVEADYDKVEVGGLMFSTAVLQEQVYDCIEAVKLLRLWVEGERGLKEADRITDLAIVASRLSPAEDDSELVDSVKTGAQAEGDK